MLAVFLVLVGPFSNLQTGRTGAFVPAYTMVMVVVDAITAVFLFAEFSIVRTCALLVISSGYFFNALIVIPWILTFPDVFVPGSLVGGTPEYAIHPFFLACRFPDLGDFYALLKDRSPEKRYWYGSVIGAVLFSIVLTIIAVLVAASSLYLPTRYCLACTRPPASQLGMALFGSAHNVIECYRTDRTLD